MVSPFENGGGDREHLVLWLCELGVPEADARKIPGALTPRLLIANPNLLEKALGAMEKDGVDSFSLSAIEAHLKNELEPLKPGRVSIGSAASAKRDSPSKNPFMDRARGLQGSLRHKMIEISSAWTSRLRDDTHGNGVEIDNKSSPFHLRINSAAFPQKMVLKKTNPDIRMAVLEVDSPDCHPTVNAATEDVAVVSLHTSDDLALGVEEILASPAGLGGLLGKNTLRCLSPVVPFSIEFSLNGDNLVVTGIHLNTSDSFNHARAQEIADLTIFGVVEAHNATTGLLASQVTPSKAENQRRTNNRPPLSEMHATFTDWYPSLPDGVLGLLQEEPVAGAHRIAIVVDTLLSPNEVAAIKDAAERSKALYKGKLKFIFVPFDLFQLGSGEPFEGADGDDTDSAELYKAAFEAAKSAISVVALNIDAIVIPVELLTREAASILVD